MSDLEHGLIGREEELDRIVRAIPSDQSVVVVGEAGIGKTTLVRAAGWAAGRAIHEGGGFATLAGLPYLATRRAIGRPVTGDPASVATQTKRAVGPDLLFVDDLQWTDPSTREVIGMLLDRILIIAGVRDGDPGARPPSTCSGTAVGIVVRVPGLSDDDALTLARRVQPDVALPRLERVVRLAGGNPLLIEELAAGAQRHRPWSVPSSARSMTSRWMSVTFSSSWPSPIGHSRPGRSAGRGRGSPTSTSSARPLTASPCVTAWSPRPSRRWCPTSAASPCACAWPRPLRTGWTGAPPCGRRRPYGRLRGRAGRPRGRHRSADARRAPRGRRRDDRHRCIHAGESGPPVSSMRSAARTRRSSCSASSRSMDRTTFVPSRLRSSRGHWTTRARTTKRGS